MKKPMDKKTCEILLLDIASDMMNTYHQYNPDGTYLTVSIIDGRVYIHNQYWKQDKDYAIRILGKKAGAADD